MNNQQNFDSQHDSQQLQSQKNKILLIIASIVIGGVVLIGSCVGYIAYVNVQKEAEEAKIAKEKAEAEKREAERIKEAAEREAAEVRRLKIEAEERERKEKEAREEKERIEREEKERIEREQAEAEQKRQEEEANRPKAEVSKVQWSTDTRFVKGELDYGVVLSGLVRNPGKSADFKVVAFLSCSSGNWIRPQLLNFSAGETKNLTYFFHEPNFGDSLSNCQGRIVAEPL